ncbi:MAG: nucleotidyltransferase [Candidatus Thorarchaeota archaeon]|nr:MAG: nucleotidyltransferase [Candidatus Thorarchaeota archaeon]
MAKKPEILHERRSVEYDRDHWALLERLRSRALQIMQALEAAGVRSFVYGSVARGDVSRNSDVDIVVPYTISSYKVEVALTGVTRRELAQATPSMVLKGHIYLENDTCVSFPLFKMKPRELEFYKWGGQVGIEEIQKGVRVHGVDKRLLLIEPTAAGHTESGVVGHETEVAKKLGVGVGIAQERVRVLMRRDTIGRTGIYRTHVLSQTESFEEVAKTLRDTDPALRRTVLRREK